MSTTQVVIVTDEVIDYNSLPLSWWCDGDARYLQYAEEQMARPDVIDGWAHAIGAAAALMFGRLCRIGARRECV